MEIRREICRAGGGDVTTSEPLRKKKAAEVARAAEAPGEASLALDLCLL